MEYAFDGFVLDSARLELRHRGTPVHLEPKSFTLLLYLVENADRVVPRDEILDHVWPGVFVTDASLSGAIAQIRRALGDSGEAQQVIRTVRGKGFHFAAALTHTAPAKVAAPVNAPAAQTGPPVIAVLPFSLIGTNDTHAAIAEAIPTELIAALSRLRAIKVIARGSSFRFASGTADHADILRQLGATYALAGTVELDTRRLSITSELIDTRSNQIVWSDRFSGAMDDIFAIRQSIVEAVTGAVELHVPLNESALLAKTPSENLDAWGLYHLGIRHLYRFNASDNERAAGFFQAALDQDPGFARAVAGLSYTEFETYNLWSEGRQTRHLSQALALAEQAVDLDAHDPFCNLVLGRAKWIAEDMNGALAWVDRAIKLNPNYAFAHYNSGKLNAISCEGAVADHRVQAAMALSPLDPHLQSMLSARAMAAFVRDDAEAALAFADQSVRAPNAHLFVCVIAAALHDIHGNTERAESVRQQIARLGSRFSEDHFWSLFKLTDPARNDRFKAAVDRLAL